MYEKFLVMVDDDPEICSTVTEFLHDRGCYVRSFLRSEGLFQYISGKRPDLILLDITLPLKSGFEICRTLREDDRFRDIPIIILSGKNTSEDKVKGLDLGADDYISKPFSLKELHARINSVLRRNGDIEDGSTTYGGLLEVDPQKHKVSVSGEEVLLTPSEFRILQLLSNRPEHVFSRERILKYLWGEEKSTESHTIDVHMFNLRKKLGLAGSFIRNVRGLGYKFSVDNN